MRHHPTPTFRANGPRRNPAEAALVDGLLQQLQGGIAAVLLDDEEADPGFVTGLDHALAVFPARGHGFFADDVATGLGDLDGLPRVQARGRGQDYGVSSAVGQQFGQRGIGGSARRFGGSLQCVRVGVANFYQFGPVPVLGDRADVILGDASTAHNGKTQLPVSNGIDGHQIVLM
ncbi:hypothetical protein G6F63_014721 [Rhizopus arrhizus]|nr:hypothetical protein G6F63_014721 [Rhizopus arrhizus]